MIVYFSGTGNSKYIAERLAEATGDRLLNLNLQLKQHNFQPVFNEKNVVFVTPTYAWRIPRVVEDWVTKTEFPDTEKVWFVMSCGGEIGNAAKYNRKLCDEKHWEYMGTAQVLMPENYIAMFNAPEKAEADRIIAEANPIIDRLAHRLKTSFPFPLPRRNVYDMAMSAVVNPVFYPLFVKDRAFRVTDYCISCGKCAKICPLNNISLKDGKPVWGGNCTHCMACICHCPTEAIEYGRKSIGKPRYHCD